MDGSFGVYIHWPFCAQKCPYCDFNSHVRQGGPDEARYLAAYLRELDWTAERLAGARSSTTPPHAAPRPSQGWPLQPSSRPPSTSTIDGRGRVTSVFFGGGTPSLMKPETVAAIIERISALWGIAGNAEITLEANPGSVEAGRFAGYKAAGVNRASLGVQSLDERELSRLGRIHSVAEAVAALAIAQRTFARVSIDLIYARPWQSAEAWRAELGRALELGTRHLSLYQLTIEPGTAYERLHAAGRLVVPDGEAALALYEITQEMTEARGLSAYEISNHAAPGEESRHNLTYWRYGTYAGIGAGAHGRILVDGRRRATVAEKSPELWLDLVERQGHGVVEDEALSAAEQADEALLMGMRLAEGLDLDRLEQVGGRRPSAAAIDGLAGLGLVERTGGEGMGGERVRATLQGRLVLNAVVAEMARSLVPQGGAIEPRPAPAVATAGPGGDGARLT